MIGQGTGGGALVSQVNLDHGVMDMFSGSEQEVRYGGVRVLPAIFQDDIMRAADSVESARAGNIKMDSVMNSKQLELNKDKTGFILLGKKDKVEKARQQILASPIMCGDFVTLEKVADKWLGDMFHQDGLAACVMATIKDRQPKVKAACYEAAAIVEDWRSQCIGGFRSAIDLFELAILPSLLYNSDTWIQIPKVAEEMLEDIQLFYLRLVLRVPQGTPKIALRSETGMLSMKLRVWKTKCMLIHHVKGLEEGTLAKMVYLEQRRNRWPGLAKEVSMICAELNIEDGNTTTMSKSAFKRVVEMACREKDKLDMLSGMEGMTKCEGLKNSDCGLKEYMGKKVLKDVRDIFRARTQLLEGFKANHKNMYRGQDMRCEGCKMDIDTQSHVLVCNAYSDLRVDQDLSKDDAMIEYFRKVLKRRMKE